jgi:hypothetical protein
MTILPLDRILEGVEHRVHAFSDDNRFIVKLVSLSLEGAEGGIGVDMGPRPIVFDFAQELSVGFFGGSVFFEARPVKG